MRMGAVQDAATRGSTFSEPAWRVGSFALPADVIGVRPAGRHASARARSTRRRLTPRGPPSPSARRRRAAATGSRRSRAGTARRG
ncbi:hypothetical protein DKG34_26075 [Streptomyces sp. NWU49]|nr:hypothetical protein DKG34_26075 [Streptomyces sp. NWU49]